MLLIIPNSDEDDWTARCLFQKDAGKIKWRLEASLRSPLFPIKENISRTYAGIFSLSTIRNGLNNKPFIYAKTERVFGFQVLRRARRYLKHQTKRNE